MPDSIAARLALCSAAALGLACDQSSDRGSIDGVAAVSGPAAVTQDLAQCDPSLSGWRLDSQNPWFPMPVGRVWTYEGEEDDEAIRLQITVLDLTEPVAGVTTRVIEEREWIDGELVEVSRNFYAQAPGGAVCYFGEAVDIYEAGQVVSHEGAWRADQSGNRPGIIMPASPKPGTKYQMEDAPGVAEDRGTVVGVGKVETPAGTFAQTIRIREFNPLDGDKGYKVFASGVGLVVDGPVLLVSVAP